MRNLIGVILAVAIVLFALRGWANAKVDTQTKWRWHCYGSMEDLLRVLNNRDFGPDWKLYQLPGGSPCIVYHR